MLRYAALLAAALPLTALALVNVNTAQQSDLERTKGLDKHKAKAIIEYRAQYGRIDDFEALAKVPGFTQETIAKVKLEIAFTGDAFVAPARAEKAKPKAKS